MHHGKLNLSKRYLSHVEQPACYRLGKFSGRSEDVMGSRRAHKGTARCLHPAWQWQLVFLAATFDGYTFLSVIRWRCQKTKCLKKHDSSWWSSQIYISGTAETAHISPLLSDTEERPCKRRLACPAGEALHRHPQTVTGIESHHVPVWKSHLARQWRRGDETGFVFSLPLPPSLPYPVGALILGGLVPLTNWKQGGRESGNSKRSDTINRLPKSLLVSAYGLQACTQCKEVHILKFSQLHSN